LREGFQFAGQGQDLPGQCCGFEAFDLGVQ